jgi:hypothetical protein
MITPSRTLVSDVRGAAKMTFDATVGAIDVVERMHRTIKARPGPLGAAPQDPTNGITVSTGPFAAGCGLSGGA